MKNKSKKFYAVVTPDVTGVFTDWGVTKSIVDGVKDAHHKSFSTFEQAKKYMLENLTFAAYKDFGLDRCPVFPDKKYVCMKAFIGQKVKGNGK